MEYAKDTEAIKGNDLKQQLNSEKTRSLELVDKLNAEKKKTNAVQEQLAQLRDELAKIKERLNKETTSLHEIWYLSN